MKYRSYIMILLKGGEYQVSKIQNIVKFGTALATVAAISPVSQVLATGTFDPTDDVNIAPDAGSAFNKLPNLRPSAFVSGAISFLLGVAGVVAFIFLLWGGLQWILAGGDKDGTEKARKKITSALVGLAIVFSAYALIFIIQALFNINVISVSLKPLSNNI